MIKTTVLPFNVNDHVRVRLTDRGRALHRKAYDDLMALARTHGGNGWDYHPVTEDAEGWSEWQLWCLMEAFGRYMSMGLDLPFNPNIQIVTEEAGAARDALTALVNSCTPVWSKLPGETKHHGTAAPDKAVLEMARAVAFGA